MLRHRVVVFAADTGVALKRTGEQVVYSIPAYALRFAAHCRSRLKYLGAGENDAGCATVAAGPARFWIHFPPHEARSRLTRKCFTRLARSAA